MARMEWSGGIVHSSTGSRRPWEADLQLVVQGEDELLAAGNGNGEEREAHRLDELEAEVMVAIAQVTRGLIRLLPRQSTVRRELAQWATELAHGAEARRARAGQQGPRPRRFRR